MRRAEILQTFQVVDDRIVNHWKYSGQLIYVPFLWFKAEEGWADGEADNGDPLFMVLRDELKEFPELAGKRMARIHENLDGSVVEVDPETGEALVVPVPAGPAPYDVGLADARRGVPIADMSPNYLRGYADGLDRA
jgi:hypothetical protein